VETLENIGTRKKQLPITEVAVAQPPKKVKVKEKTTSIDAF